jgi:hypothetical protein
VRGTGQLVGASTIEIRHEAMGAAVASARRYGVPRSRRRRKKTMKHSNAIKNENKGTRKLLNLDTSELARVWGSLSMQGTKR